MANNLLDFLDQEITDLDRQIADIEFRLQNAFSACDASDVSVESAFSQQTFLQAPAQSTQIDRAKQHNHPDQTNSTIKMPFPVFDPHNIEIWLWTVDRWFLASGINSDDVKLNSVLLALPSESLAVLRSELDTPPIRDRYDFIKNTRCRWCYLGRDLKKAVDPASS